jgi:hypothetical protein
LPIESSGTLDREPVEEDRIGNSRLQTTAWFKPGGFRETLP